MKERSVRRLARLGSWLLIALLVCTLSVTAYAAEPEPACYGYGDVNGDNGVDGRDAIYTLYHVLFGETYPANQDCDFNEDGTVDSKDAIRVLYGSLGMVPDCTFGGTVHQYYAPEWTWSDSHSVTVKFRCGCGSVTVLTEHNGVAVEKSDVARLSCTDVGTVSYTARVTFDGREYTNVHTVTIPAQEHAMQGIRSCTDSSVCSVCGYTLPALDHDWVEDAQNCVPATCQVPGVQAYKCGREGCAETKTVTLEGLAEHNFKHVQDVQTENSCAWVKEYVCSVCQAPMTGETFFKHTYTTTLTREASCSAEGEMTYTCVCGHSKTETVAKNDSHLWDGGVTDENGITTFTCSGCGATKTAVLAQGNNATVEKQALTDAELQLENAYVKLDEETLDDLGEQIGIDVDILSVSDITLEESLAQQIGSNSVYDFSLFSDENQVSQFAGLATITLPYTLQEGDDAECIDVWFISDSGEVTCVQGTYSNGFVTFTTDHFSYYTVTRLTPQQRCAHYGHAWGIDHQDPTCTRNGHHVVACRRCGEEQENTVLDRLPHNYEETREEPTCTQEGSLRKVCTVCRQTVTGTLPALGHAWTAGASSAPTCTDAGKTVYTCGNSGCTETYTEETPALGHNYEMIGQVASDCTTSGYEGYKCSVCGHEYKANEVSPVGHDFSADTATWQWDKDYAGATVTLTCSRNPEHTQVLTAVITKTVDAPNCNAGGDVTYKAVAAFNLKEYTDSKTLHLEKVGHQAGSDWKTISGSHYHECTACGEMMDVTAHTWGEITATTAPTCAKAGKGTAACTVCGYEKELILEATAEHSFAGEVCTVCGFRKENCTHFTGNHQEMDLSSFGICQGFTAYVNSCECGENAWLDYEAMCNFGEETEVTGILPNGETGTIITITCSDCGLKIEHAGYVDTDKATCYCKESAWTRLSQNGTTILETYSFSTETGGYHAGTITVQTIDLSQYGLCGVTLEQMRCYCGEKMNTFRRDDLCQWDFLQGQNGNHSFVCNVCGATRAESNTQVQDKANCKAGSTEVTSYILNGQTVYTYTNEYEWDLHDYQLKNYRMDGDSCEDGIYIEKVCSACGKENNYYATWHEQAYRQETDISSLGLCPEAYYEDHCICGKMRSFGLVYPDYGHCDFIHSKDDNGVETRRCQTCGLVETATTTYGPKDENCIRLEERAITYTTADGTVIAKGSDAWDNQAHDDVVDMQLHGTSCEDGVTITHVCRDCGYTSSWETNHHNTEKLESYDLSQYGLCGGELRIYGCACGYDSWESWNNEVCEWHYVSGDEHTEILRCEKCGVTRKEVRSDRKEAGQCRYERDISITFIKNNKTLLKVGYTQSEHVHRNVYSFALDGQTCLDGYRVTRTCQDCGEASSWHVNEEEHGTWAVKRELIVKDQLCSDLELVTYSCACGTYNGQDLDWTGEHCNFYSSGPVAEDYDWNETCSNCGSERIYGSNEKRGSIPCSVETHQRYIISKNGTELWRGELVRLRERHDWNYSYEMFGSDCTDGYRTIRICADCGLTEMCGTHDMCNYWQIGREVLLDNETICGPVCLVTYDSPCGKDYRVELSTEWCRWHHVGYDSETNASIYQCPDCGLRRTGRTERTQQNGSCDVKAKLNYTFSLNGQVLLTLDREVEQKEHEHVATFEMNGQTCDEGYRPVYSCVYCGRVSLEGTYYGHHTHRTAYYNLSDYGMCGGEIWRNSCPCGHLSDWNYSSGGCNWYETGNTAGGMEEYYCAQCDTYRYDSESGSRNPATCLWEGKFGRLYIRGGETVLNISGNVSREDHRYVVQSFSLNVPSAGCEAGYYATMVCTDCGDTNTEEGYGHGTYTVEYIDLKEQCPDSCGGYIAYERCACGESTNVYYDFDCANTSSESRNEEGTDGYPHYIYKESCSDCGLSRISDRCEIRDKENCTLTYRYTYTFSQNNTLIAEYQDESVQKQHTYGETTVQLDTGAASCEDGVIRSQTCKICGYVSQSRYNDHTLGLADSTDLSAYGSVCGAALNHYSCACGKYQRYDLSEDSQCDMDRKWIDNFVPGTIDDSQYTTQEYVTTYSDSYILTCAVTDPQCTMKIRMSEYWLVENCMATEYQTWQLDYDEETKTFQKELTVPTGEKHAYHNYISGSSTETLADGTEVQISTETCSSCGSSHITKSYYLNDTQIKFERIANNTKDNGERKRYYYVAEWGIRNSGYRYITLERTEYTKADGTDYWQQYAYTYDFATTCRRITTYTNSNGETNVYADDAHNTSWHREDICGNTCTQFGKYIGRWICDICGTVTSESTYSVNPSVHSWRYNTDEEIYECGYCGLKNINGASGSIVLEDMTADYGNSTNYVVGYWNRGDVEARKYLSVIYFDADGNETMETILSDVAFTTWDASKDGVTAVVFSMDDAQTAANTAIAEAGYTGSYAIRFTFVPVGSEDTLDYAITFDSQTA